MRQINEKLCIHGTFYVIGFKMESFDNYFDNPFVRVFLNQNDKEFETSFSSPMDTVVIAALLLI